MTGRTGSATGAASQWVGSITRLIEITRSAISMILRKKTCLPQSINCIKDMSSSIFSKALSNYVVTTK